MTTYSRQVRLCNNTCPCIETELHLTDLFIDLLHKADRVSLTLAGSDMDCLLNDEVHDFVLQHALGMIVSDQERDIVSL